jgi:hypothetical protein
MAKAPVAPIYKNSNRPCRGKEKQTAVDILFEGIEASLKQTAPFTWLLGKRPNFGTWVEKSLEQNSTCNKSSPPRKRRPSNQKKRRSASSDDDNDNTNNETATTTTAPEAHCSWTTPAPLQ